MTYDQLVQACLGLSEGAKTSYTLAPGVTISGINADVYNRRTDGLAIAVSQSGRVVQVVCYRPVQTM